MIEEVVIQSSSGPAKLILYNPEFGDDALLEFYSVRVEDDGLVATTRVDADSALTKGLDELFADLATNWRGWDGEKVGGSIDDNLFLSCHADKLGHTFIAVTLSQSGNWTVEGKLQLDAAQLEPLAKQLKRFFHPALNAI